MNTQLLPHLIEIQHKQGYLPIEDLEALSIKLNIPMQEISSTATFYAAFRFKPQGKHIIKVCVGAACYVKGAERVYDAFQKYLNIPPTEDTDPTGEFSLTKVACLGCCMLAVAVQIDNHIYGWVDPQNIDTVIRSFRESQRTASHAKSSRKSNESIESRIEMCCCSSCNASGAEKIWSLVQNEIRKYDLPVQLRKVSCTGMSHLATQVTIFDGENFYHYARVQHEDLHHILSRHFNLTQPLAGARWKLASFFHNIYHPTKCRCDDKNHQSPFQLPQTPLIVTEHRGESQPLDINDYKQRGGFSAFEKCLTTDSNTIIQTLIDAKLRGRGGAGFLTGMKWKFAHQSVGDTKYIVCNADEGDPGAFMDRMVLESFPYRVLEGMLIAAHTLQAQGAFIYIREEYTQAIQILRKAIQKCEEHHLFEKISPTFKISLFLGAGAFVCGEETALLESMEGKRGIPRARPPFPTQAGYLGMPTLMNNVETFACIPWIFRNGAEAFSALGTTDSAGTKSFALAGKIKNGGLIEVPMGQTLRDIVNLYGGGVETGHTLKAVLIGGPSGGCIPEDKMDIPVDYERLTQMGAMMGSGGLVVLDERDCMVDISLYFLKFMKEESCGKCTLCREGIIRLYGLLEALTKRNETPFPENYLEEIATLSRQIQQGSLCGLGRTASNVVLSALKYFRPEFEAHLHGACPAGKCIDLAQFFIDETCIGCTKCAQSCAVDAIAFAPFERHFILQEKCVKCGVCRDICTQKSVQVKTLIPTDTIQATEEMLATESRKSVDAHHILMDDIEIPFEQCSSLKILDGAHEFAQVEIPTLCYLKGCQEQARCMVCAVYDATLQRFVPACETRFEAGHVYELTSERVIQFRKEALALLFDRHDFTCKTCRAISKCELLKLRQKYPIPRRHQNATIDTSIQHGKHISYQRSRCVLCGRCTGKGSNLSFQYRGEHTRIAPALNQTWNDIPLKIAQDLVSKCPVGAITLTENNT